MPSVEIYSYVIQYETKGCKSEDYREMFLIKCFFSPVTKIYYQNLSKEDTIHMLHKEEGDPSLGLLLVVVLVVLQCPKLEGLDFQMVRIQSQQQQVELQQQSPDRPAGGQWEI